MVADPGLVIQRDLRLRSGFLGRFPPSWSWFSDGSPHSVQQTLIQSSENREGGPLLITVVNRTLPLAVMGTLYTPPCSWKTWPWVYMSPSVVKVNVTHQSTLSNPFTPPEHHWRITCLYCSGISYCPESGVMRVTHSENKIGIRDGQTSLGLYPKFESLCWNWTSVDHSDPRFLAFP